MGHSSIHDDHRNMVESWHVWKSSGGWKYGGVGL